MDCVCVAKCQVKPEEGRPVRYDVGDVADFDKCPTHFRPLNTTVDFAEVGEKELIASTFELEDLKSFILDTYNIKAGNRGRDKAIELLIDCRERAVKLTKVM